MKTGSFLCSMTLLMGKVSYRFALAMSSRCHSERSQAEPRNLAGRVIYQGRDPSTSLEMTRWRRLLFGHRCVNLVFIAATLLLAVAGCNKAQKDEVILARIDDAIITAEEFQLNYEFGHGHLRRGEDPRRAYLNFMIFEKVLALEARKINLDTAQAVIHAMHTLREEVLIERVFEEKALSKVEVTEQEIRDEINRAAVSFQFRFLPARSEEDAHKRYEHMLERGYEAVLAENREEFAELNLSEENLKSPLVKAEDMEPAILEVLKDLAINTPSKPVRYQGQWYIFEVVAIERQPLGEADYAQKAPTYRKILYNKKAMELATAFVAETMEPLQVVTRRQGFDILNEALWTWYRHETPARNLLHYIEEQGWDTAFTKNSSRTTRRRWFNSTIKTGPLRPSWSILRPDAIA